MKIGIIGIGNMGKNHLRVSSEILAVTQIVIADLNDKVGQDFSKKYDAIYYKDYRKMILKEKPRAVLICVPTKYHYEVAKFCIERKIHCLIEKPITLDVKSAQKLLLSAKKHRTILHVGHIERYNPAVRKVKELIKNGDLGKIIAIMARRVGGFPPQITDANIAVDLAIHDIDVVNFLLEDYPKDISVNMQRNHIKKRGDSVEFFLKYKKTSAYVQANWISPVKIRKLNITGTEGYLEMDYVSQKIEFYKSNYSKFKQKIGNFSDFVLRFSNPEKLIIPLVKKEPLDEEIRHFIGCVEGNIRLNPQFAVNALKIATYSSIK